jgi:hypothetical protein
MLKSIDLAGIRVVLDSSLLDNLIDEEKSAFFLKVIEACI